MALPWLVVAGVLWAADRSGPLVVGQDPADLIAGRDEARLLRSGRRQAGGFEGRARWMTPFNGLSAEGTLAAVAIDEGVFFRGADPFGPKPARGVPRPTGAAAIHWAPTDWPLHVWGRMRYALPQARLAPDEELDASLCPEGLLETQVQPCSGLFGYALYDFGMAFEPSRYLRLEAMAANLLDAPWQLRISELPGGGLSARAAATVRF